MKIRKLVLACVSSIILVPGLLFAGDTDAAKTPTKVDFSGFIDGSYNHLSQSNEFTSGSYDRVYDLNENGFTLQQLAGTASYLPQDGLGFLLNGLIGRDAIVSNAYGMGTWTSSPDFGVDLTQAYLRLGYNTLTLDAGKFVTVNGVETIAPITDTNFARSILFGFGGPFTATGARATYQANKKLKLIFGLNDGWDTITDWSRGPTTELNATYIFNPIFTLALTSYIGRQRVTDRTSVGPTGTRTLIDVVGTVTITPKLSVNINYDYAWQTLAALPDETLARANWRGIASYLNYTFNDSWRTSLRGEYFADQQGFRTGVAQDWKEVTLTLAYVPQRYKNLEIRGEVRRDFSNVASFANKNNDGSSDVQQSYAVEAFYKFG